MALTNEELASMYIKYKQQLNFYKHRDSFQDINKYLESKEYLSLLKLEMKKRGLKKKHVKRQCNY